MTAISYLQMIFVLFYSRNKPIFVMLSVTNFFFARRLALGSSAQFLCSSSFANRLRSLYEKGMLLTIGTGFTMILVTFKM